MRCRFWKRLSALCSTMVALTVPFSTPSLAQESGNKAGSAAAGDLMVIPEEYKDTKAPVKNFKMAVPVDWDVKHNFMGYALFMKPKNRAKPSAENPIVADPQLTVAVLRMAAIKNPVYIDKQGVEEYGKIIERELVEAYGEGTQVEIFLKDLLDKKLPGEKSGLLYYVSYINNGLDHRSAILVMANKEVMYRVTLTDYKVGFDKNLDRYYPIMSSIEIGGEPLERRSLVEVGLPYAVPVGVVLVLILALRWFKGQRMKRLLNEVSSSDGADDGSFEGTSGSGSEPPRRKRDRHSPDEEEDGSGYSESPNDDEEEDAPPSRNRDRKERKVKTKVIAYDEDEDSAVSGGGFGDDPADSDAPRKAPKPPPPVRAKAAPAAPPPAKPKPAEARPEPKPVEAKPDAAPAARANAGRAPESEDDDFPEMADFNGGSGDFDEAVDSEPPRSRSSAGRSR